MQKRITVCDVCEREGQLTAYSVKGAGRAVNVDLCATDAEPIAALLGLLGRKRPASPRRGKSTGALPVTTLGDIEAAKR